MRTDALINCTSNNCTARTRCSQMDIHDLTRTLHVKNDSKIVMLVADGLGGLPLRAGRTDRAGSGADAQSGRAGRPGRQGLIDSGEARHHPRQRAGAPGRCSATIRSKYLIGRGALEATGIGFELHENDVAIRCNFCTVDAAGQHHRPPRRPDPHRGECPAGREAARGQDRRRRGLRRAGQGASLRGRVPRRGLGGNVRRHRPASDRRAAAGPRGRRPGQRADGRGRQGVPRPRPARFWPAKPRPTA